MIAGYVGKGSRFEEAMLEFAGAYADQTARDWKLLVAAKGRRSIAVV